MCPTARPEITLTGVSVARSRFSEQRTLRAAARAAAVFGAMTMHAALRDADAHGDLSRRQVFLVELMDAPCQGAAQLRIGATARERNVDALAEPALGGEVLAYQVGGAPAGALDQPVIVIDARWDINAGAADARRDRDRRRLSGDLRDLSEYARHPHGHRSTTPSTLKVSVPIAAAGCRHTTRAVQVPSRRRHSRALRTA